MPIPYLEPCVAAIAELAAHYRSTIVLCTATQPVLDEMIRKISAADAGKRNL